MTVKEIAH